MASSKKNPTLVRDESPGEPVDANLGFDAEPPMPEPAVEVAPSAPPPSPPSAPVKVPTSAGAPQPARYRILEDKNLSWYGQPVFFHKNQILNVAHHGREGVDMLIRAGLPVEPLP